MRLLIFLSSGSESERTVHYPPVSILLIPHRNNGPAASSVCQNSEFSRGSVYLKQTAAGELEPPSFVVGLPSWSKDLGAVGSGLDPLQAGSCPPGGLNDPLRGSSHRQVTVNSVVDLLRVTRTPKSPQEVKSLLVLMTRLHDNHQDKGLKSSISQSKHPNLKSGFGKADVLCGVDWKLR